MKVDDMLIRMIRIDILSKLKTKECIAKQLKYLAAISYKISSGC